MATAEAALSAAAAGSAVAVVVALARQRIGGGNAPLTNIKCFEKHIILIVLGRSTPKILF